MDHLLTKQLAVRPFGSAFELPVSPGARPWTAALGDVQLSQTLTGLSARDREVRESELLRHLFETTVARCIEEGLASRQRMAVDASVIEADANNQNSTLKEEWDASTVDPADAPRAVHEYLHTLDNAAFGAASEVQPKFTSHSDPASQWTAARKGPAFFSYSDNYLIDTDHGVILDVEGTRSIRQAEAGLTQTMLTRVKDKFDLVPDCMITPSRDIAAQCTAGRAVDTAYGSSPMLGWLMDRKIDPYIPVIHCPAGDCGAISREGTRPNAPTAPGHARTSNGMPRMINISAPRVTRSNSFSGINLIQTGALPARARHAITP